MVTENNVENVLRKCGFSVMYITLLNTYRGQSCLGSGDAGLQIIYSILVFAHICTCTCTYYVPYPTSQKFS